MKNIMVNFLIRKDVDKDKLLNSIKNCKSEKFNIKINVCDYSLEKDNQIDKVESLPDFSFHELDYEDTKLHDYKIKELANGRDFFAFIDLESSMELPEGFLDELELESLEDQNISAVYSDFFSKTKTGRTVHIHQKSFPLVNNSLPLVAFSMHHYLTHEGKENIKGLILSNAISKHIPKPLCTVNV